MLSEEYQQKLICMVVERLQAKSSETDPMPSATAGVYIEDARENLSQEKFKSWLTKLNETISNQLT